MALPFERLGELIDDDAEPWAPEGPVGPARAVLLGAWFMMREQELATTRACLVDLQFKTELPEAAVVSWSLPASKNDPEATGVSRSHGCCCKSSRSRLCPFHAAVDQMDFLKKIFPDKFSEGVPDPDLPFFPASDGNVVSKEGVTETIIQAARKLQVPLATPDGSERISGHSLRVTGAQGLTVAGLDAWAVQLLGRWGSDTVLTYIRAVPLKKAAEWAKRVVVPIEDKLKDFERTKKAVTSEADASLLGGGRSDLSEQVEAARQAAVVAELPSEACAYVRSARGSFHRVGKLETKSATWMSACGWRFCKDEASISETLPPEVHYKYLCTKCLPKDRESRKAALS